MYGKHFLFGALALAALSLVLGSCKGSNNKTSMEETMNLDSLKTVFGGEVDTFDADGQGTTKVSIFSIRHATMAICADGKWIYVDPNTSVLGDGMDYSSMPKADFILFTHDHSDHFDNVSVEQLSKETTRIIANPTVAGTLGCCDSLHNGESATICDGWTVDAVPAYNVSEEKLQFHPQGRDNGYVLSIGDLRIYIAGDTEVIPEMADIKDIDIAFLPCNLPFTMTPEQCAEAAKTIMPKILFPYHYGHTQVSRVPELLDGTGIEVRIRQYQ